MFEWWKMATDHRFLYLDVRFQYQPAIGYPVNSLMGTNLPIMAGLRLESRADCSVIGGWFGEQYASNPPATAGRVESVPG